MYYTCSFVPPSMCTILTTFYLQSRFLDHDPGEVSPANDVTWQEDEGKVDIQCKSMTTASHRLNNSCI